MTYTKTLAWATSTVSELRNAASEFLTAHPKVKPAGVAAALMLMLYVGGKMREEPPHEIAPGAALGEFQGGRLFGSSSAALLRERDVRLGKQAQDYMEALKAVKDQVTVVAKKVAAIEAGQAAAPATTVKTLAGTSSQAGGSAVGAEASQGAPIPPAAASWSANAVQALGAMPVGASVASPYMGVGPLPPEPRTNSQLPWSPVPRVPSRGPATISFPVRSEVPLDLGIVLPPGSYVKATMLTGVAAPEGRPYPVLLQADYAYILPSRHRLDLAGCYLIAKAQGDLSTERLQMQATKMSCVGRDGRMFERDVAGFVADGLDNNFAVSGEVVSKQDRVAVMSFLASVAQGVGRAIQQAQTTQQTTPLGGSQSVVTGDQQKYLAAGGVSDAAGQVSAWYLKEAQGLLPTINVNSGVSVWVVMQESVTLPKSYFKHQSQRGPNDDSYDYVTRLLE